MSTLKEEWESFFAQTVAKAPDAFSPADIDLVRHTWHAGVAAGLILKETGNQMQLTRDLQAYFKETREKHAEDNQTGRPDPASG